MVKESTGNDAAKSIGNDAAGNNAAESIKRTPQCKENKKKSAVHWEFSPTLVIQHFYFVYT